MNPVFFKNPAEFREWLHLNHQNAKELIVGFYKTGSGKANMSWSESVDEALCYGWIDGVRRSVDHESYCIRFTPRRADSIWSTINIRKMDQLMKEGRMTPAGLDVFQKRKEEKSKVYSFENQKTILSEELETQFKQHKTAWSFFLSLAPSYQKTSIHWIMSAKQESTRQKRLHHIIEESTRGQNPWKNNPNKNK